jgi:hypothetical protein
MTVFCLPGTMPDRGGMNKGEIRIDRERKMRKIDEIERD